METVWVRLRLDPSAASEPRVEETSTTDSLLEFGARWHSGGGAKVNFLYTSGLRGGVVSGRSPVLVYVG